MKKITLLILAIISSISAFNCGDAPIEKFETYIPNKAPIITNFTSNFDFTRADINPGVRINVQVAAYDPENDALTFEFSSAHGSFTNMNVSNLEPLCTIDFIIGNISGNETVIVQVKVIDSRGSSAMQTLDIGTSKTGPTITLLQEPQATIASNGFAMINFISDSDGYYRVQLIDDIQLETASDINKNIFLINKNQENSVNICGPNYTGELYVPGIPRLNHISKSPDKIMLIVSDRMGQETRLPYIFNIAGNMPWLETSSLIKVTGSATSSIGITWSPARDIETSQENLLYRVYYSKNTLLNSLENIENYGIPVGDWEKAIIYKNIQHLQQDTAYYINVVVKDEEGNRLIYSMLQAQTAKPLVIEAVVSPATGSALSPTSAIAVQFNRPPDENSLAISGLMAEDISINWSSGDLVIISPKTCWPLGSNKNLLINYQDSEGNTFPQVTMTYHILDGNVYVHPSGNDVNPGTKDLPKASISDAINSAASLFSTAAVRVAGGNYTINNGLVDTYIILHKGISVYGGYSPDFSARDSSTYISDISVTPNTGYLNRIVDCGEQVTNETVFDGFSLNGERIYTSYGVYCYNSSPTIQNVTMYATSGIYAINSSVLIKNNQIIGEEYGVFCKNSSCIIKTNHISLQNTNLITSVSSVFLDSYTSSLVEGNSIAAGENTSDNNYSSGISVLNNSNSIIRNNSIHGGCGSFNSTGIFVSFSSATIENNTINGGTSNTLASGIDFFDSAVTIENNIIFTNGTASRYCIQESSDNNHPTTLKNNNLFNCPILYHDLTNGDLTGIADLNNPAMTGAAAAGGNLSENLISNSWLLDDDGNYNTLTHNDWNLHVTVPLSISQGGLDLSGSFSLDKNGNARTVPWSIGAYEKD